MNHRQGLSATALFVIGASKLRVPVSTTHVSVDALVGIGLTTRQAHLGVVAGIVPSGPVPLACAAVIGGFAY